MKINIIKIIKKCYKILKNKIFNYKMKYNK